MTEFESFEAPEEKGLEQAEKGSHIEFPTFTEADMEGLEKTGQRIADYIRYPMGYGFRQYTGNGHSLGSGSILNSTVTSSQVANAIAMTRSPLITEMLESNRPNKKSDELFVANQIMSGMKILDLGSGPVPVLARICRYMGANVWTVDVEKLDGKYDGSLFPSDMQELEMTHHILLDLNDPDIVNILREKTGGNFNLATAGHLSTSGFYYGADVGMNLLKSGGVYYEPLRGEPKLKK